jgi:hypothetical protein
MQLIHVDTIESQSLEAAFDCIAEVSRSRVVRPLIWARTIPAAFGRNEQSLGIRKEGFSDELFAHVGTIRVGCIDEVDVQLYRAAKNGERTIAIARRSPDAFARETHGSEPKAMDGELASERNLSG